MKAQSSEQIMRCDFPYTIQPTGCGVTFVVLNRNYQPLGVTVESGLPMEQYKDEFRSQVQFANSKIFPAHDGGAFYLYGPNGNPPWCSKQDAIAYLDRLKDFYQRVMWEGAKARQPVAIQ